jgi:WD40 repeat protein
MQDTIYVYHTITFANLHVLKGHQGEVTYVTWSQDDLKLVSCADNGSVYEWNAATGGCSYIDYSIQLLVKFCVHMYLLYILYLVAI